MSWLAANSPFTSILASTVFISASKFVALPFKKSAGESNSPDRDTAKSSNVKSPSSLRGFASPGARRSIFTSETVWLLPETSSL